MTKKRLPGGHLALDPEAVAAALRASGGIIAVAAANLGCSRETVYNHVEKHEVVRNAQHQGDEAITDLAEAKAVQKIKKGFWKAIEHRLNTKGRKRGYVKRTEIGGVEGGDIPLSIKLVPFTPPPEAKGE